MAGTDFEQRKNRILELVIEAYVSSVEPVGSQFIARKLRGNLSSATIRNIMGELEEAGYLEQPHTSAGRVPTERGYRFYVDSVMESRSLPEAQLRQIESLIHPEEMDVDHLLARAGEALAELTQQASFVIAPTVKQSTVRQIELVPVGIRKVLCVMIANEEIVASHVVETEELLSKDETAALVRFLNAEMVGLPFGELLESLERRMLAERDTLYHLVKRSLNILQHALSTEPAERLFMDGMSYVVSQPEFSRDPRKAHELMKGLDAEEPLLTRVRQDLSGSSVTVRIGHEVQVSGLEECSYVASAFAIKHQVVGGVGILGPKRMDYPRMRSMVEAMGRSLTELLTRWEQG